MGILVLLATCLLSACTTRGPLDVTDVYGTWVGFTEGGCEFVRVTLGPTGREKCVVASMGTSLSEEHVYEVSSWDLPSGTVRVTAEPLTAGASTLSFVGAGKAGYSMDLIVRDVGGASQWQRRVHLLREDVLRKGLTRTRRASAAWRASGTVGVASPDVKQEGGPIVWVPGMVPLRTTRTLFEWTSKHSFQGDGCQAHVSRVDPRDVDAFLKQVVHRDSQWRRGFDGRIEDVDAMRWIEMWLKHYEVWEAVDAHVRFSRIIKTPNVVYRLVTKRSKSGSFHNVLLWLFDTDRNVVVRLSGNT
jgi:hypothetical protein